MQPASLLVAAWFAVAAVAFVASPAMAQGTDAIIETFAGGGGDAMAELSPKPPGVAVDGSGNVYIADYGYNRIRMVDSSGVISTFAGTGIGGFGGDGGAATAARLSSPHDVAVDSSGNVYIADVGNSRIRMVDSSGVISTFAGTGTRGFGGDGGAATSSLLAWPAGVSVDSSGNVYIADGANNRIRKVDSSGIISTFAGTAAQGFGGDGGSATSSLLSAPYEVAVDGSGNVYIPDRFNNRIRKVDSSGVISTFAGTGTYGFGGDGGSATSSLLAWPQGVAVDGSGNVYIADTGNHRIRKVDASSGNISTILAAPAIYAPTGVALDGSGNVYVAESSSVRKVDALTNDVSTLAAAGSYGFDGDGGAATAARLAYPTGVALDASGNVYIADSGSNRIRKVDSSGVISTFAGTGIQGGGTDGGAATSSLLAVPIGVAVDSSDNVYIDSGNRIRKVDASGIISTLAGTGTWGFAGDGGAAASARLAAPEEVAADGSGNVYIADTGNHRVRRVDSSGIISTFAGTGTLGFGGDGGSATSSLLRSPRGVAVDSSGNVYIADTWNNRIRRVDSSGIISTFAGSGTGTFGGFDGDGGAATSSLLRRPQGVAVDGSGNVYIADTGNHRIRKVDSSGIISTFAGSGRYFGGLGDGGSATSALLRSPRGVAVDSSGNVYIADQFNNRIRRVVPGRPPLADTSDPSEPPDAPNSPPEVLVALEDVTLAGGQMARIDLGSAFSDPNDDVLDYSAASSAPAVVLASVVGDVLVLEGVSAGMATVTVSATDPHGLRVEQTLAVTVGTVLSLDGDSTAVEGGTVRLSVRLSTVRQVATLFTWRVLEDDDPATADADAGEHGDASGSGSIAAGETAATIDIAIADDADVERTREWFLVELAADGEDPVVLGRSQATVAVLEGVCDRTPAVAAALVQDGGCETATDAGLAALRTLGLEDAGIAALRSEDLAGLHGLQVLGLGGNALAELPADLLSAAPGLRFLLLGGNRLTALRADAFAGLSELRELDLSDNALAELPAGMLSDLPELRRLRLDGNALEALTDSLFSGVSTLRSVRLDGNPGAPFALRAELRRNDAPPAAEGPATIQATLAVGAPFDVELSLEATGGRLRSTDGSMSKEVQASLAAGETASAELVVVASDMAAVQVSVAVAPMPETVCNGLPCWRGLSLAAGDPLVLFAAPPRAADVAPEPAPLFGEDLRLPLVSLATAGSLPVTWRVASLNPSVATASIDGDELVVATEAGVEGETEIEVAATDAMGQSVTVRFQVRVDFYWPGSRRWRLALPINAE